MRDVNNCRYWVAFRVTLVDTFFARMDLDLPIDEVNYRIAEVAGVAISYLDVGNGENVLIIPGWSLSPRIYEESASLLALSGFRVVIPQVYGLSSKQEFPLELDGLVSQVAHFAKMVFEGQSFSLVGHSLGGAVATLLVAPCRTNVCKLVLVNSIGDPTWINSHGRVSVMSQRPINNWIGSFVLDFAKTKHKNRFMMRLTSDSVNEFIRHPSRVVQYALIARSLDLRNSMALISQMNLPTLAIWTDNDVVIPKESFESLVKNLNASRMVLDGTHAWIYSMSKQFAIIVGNFLKA